jgi:hypothetical protein
VKYFPVNFKIQNIARVEVNTVILPNIQSFQYAVMYRKMSSHYYFKGVLPTSSMSSTQRRILLEVLVSEENIKDYLPNDMI